VSLRVERSDATVVLTIDRPGTRNAIDAALAKRLAEAATEAAADPSARAIVLTATGAEAFVSGGDLNEIAGHVRDGGGPGPVLDMYAPLLVLEAGELPVIAAVGGDVYGGGCELILLCDMVVMENHAKLAFRHARMGLSPAWGGMTRLMERVGPQEASRLLFTAEEIEATEAQRIGLVGEVVPTGRALGRALERAAIAATSTSPDRARVVADALLAGGPKPTLAPLIEAGDTLDPAAKSAEAIERIEAAVVPAFVALVRHPAIEVRTRAVEFLAQRPEKDAQSAIVDALSDPEESVRRAALRLFATSPRPRSDCSNAR